MPKMKTNSGAKKRFALTGTGKIKRKHAFKSHILTKKTTKQKRNLTHTGLVASVDVSNVKQLLGLKGHWFSPGYGRSSESCKESDHDT